MEHAKSENVIVVFGLTKYATSEDVHDICSRSGPCTIIERKGDEAIVLFDDYEDAENAVRRFDGAEFVKHRTKRVSSTPPGSLLVVGVCQSSSLSRNLVATVKC